MKLFAFRHPFLFRLFIWILLPILIGCALVAYMLMSSLPQRHGVVHITGVKEDVSIHRGSEGIPYIKAQTDKDVYFALGFCHAQDRLWQLEMNKRKASGRLSEIFGISTLESDKFFRILSLKRNSQKIWQRLSEKDKEILSHYSNGINEGIKQTRVLPLEFLLNNFSPEAWSPLDSILIMQLMTWNLSTNIGSEINRMLLLQNFGLDKTNLLMPAIKLPYSVAINSISQTEFVDKDLWSSELKPKQFVGSNAWVVAGKFTASGAPILANDPHLATALPSIWYLAHMEGNALDVTGATMPGLPFVLIGRNKDIAWGMTTMMADTQDLILEKINPVNKNQYQNQGIYRDMEVEKETIFIKKEYLRPASPPYKIDIRSTANGPLISDVGTFADGFTYSLRWTGEDEDGGSISSLIALNYAKNWTDFNQAFSSFVAPVHYIVYADRHGNIGSLAAGKIPIRHFGYGDLPVEGWRHDNNWIGWIPFSELPRQYNPHQGYIVAANHRVIAKNYPYHIATDWATDDRALRIDAELKRLTAGKIQEKDMAILQNDVKSAYQKDIFPSLVKLPPKNKRQKDVLDLLANWDGNMDSATISGTILQAWKFHLQKLTLEDDIGDIKGLEDLAETANPKFLRKILAGTNLHWCDYKNTPEIETCEDIQYIALDYAIADLSIRLGADPGKWQWGKIHKIEFPHFPFSKPGHSPHWPQTNESLWNHLFHQELSAGGDETTVNIGPFSGNKDSRYFQFHAASYRQLVDMKNISNISFEQTTGQSGNIISKNFSDGIGDNKGRQLLESDKLQFTETLILSPSQRSPVKK